MITGINFPAGGFRVNADLQVLNVYGEPIPKLFAVGDCSGGLGPVIGMGGMRITPALTLGRVAGRKIATQKFECSPNSERLDEYIPSNTMKVPSLMINPVEKTFPQLLIEGAVEIRTCHV